MTTQQRQWKRRNYMINPGFQLRFMLYIAGGMISGFAVMYFANHWYINVLTQQGVELGLDPGHVYFEFIEQQRSLMNITFVVVCTTVFTVLMVASLLLSHKIAGPIYRVTKYTRELIAGEVTAYPVSLRKGDFFPELATMVNDLVAAKQSAVDAALSTARQPAATSIEAAQFGSEWSIEVNGHRKDESPTPAAGSGQARVVAKP